MNLQRVRVDLAYELSLEDDYPYALTAILPALHRGDEAVPVDPAFKDLVELAMPWTISEYSLILMVRIR